MFPIVAAGAVALAALFLEGCTGETGPEGERGPAGPRGSKGEMGPVGPQGLPGQPGQQGNEGPRGPQGSQGATGPQGQVGPRGPGVDWSRCRFISSNLVQHRGTGSVYAEEDLDCGQGQIIINGGCDFRLSPSRNPISSLWTVNAPCTSVSRNVILSNGPLCFGIPDNEAALRGWFCRITEYAFDPMTIIDAGVVVYGTCCPRL